ncbi:MAG: T9SS type A sorting domain-containing protein [Bacteroidota bacterium]|nr:T9SS type A sorting domain-containing protein [Bacteroidota bacterium]MDP4229116.1 T9SS type A sorting domain-containing protein [Bacteroidota bacterium]
MSNDTSRFDHYRAWLILALDLNRSCEDYFCAVVGAIASTYQYGRYVPLAHLAVLNYLRHEHPNCWGSGGDKEYAADSAADAFVNIDGYTVKNLPPLDSIGLGFLLDKSKAPHPRGSFESASLTSSPNPFTNDLTLTFTLSQVDHVQLAIYDILGHVVWQDAKGSPLEIGTHSISIDGKNLPHGTLYARFSTSFGEVETVKLIHE